MLAQEVAHGDIDDMKSEMVTSVYERRSSLELFDKVSKKLRLVWVVKTLHASLGANRTVVCL